MPQAHCTAHGYDATDGCAECVALVRARFPSFPIAREWKRSGPESIPWPVAERAWAAYAARYGRAQSVERIAQRGGFYAEELDGLLPGWRELAEARP